MNYYLRLCFEPKGGVSIDDAETFQHLVENYLNGFDIEFAGYIAVASIDKKNSGTWGDFGAFSLHPLKNINVWSDGGIITTNNLKYYNQLRLLRNHGISTGVRANYRFHTVKRRFLRTLCLFVIE